MKLTIKCFHEAEFKAYPMKPLLNLENNAVSYKCTECGREIIIEMEFDENK